MNDQFSDIIGLTIEEATPKVSDRGISTIRAKMVDGQSCIVTMDMRANRLNVSIDDGKISSVGSVG